MYKLKDNMETLQTRWRQITQKINCCFRRVDIFRNQSANNNIEALTQKLECGQTTRRHLLRNIKWGLATWRQQLRTN